MAPGCPLLSTPENPSYLRAFACGNAPDILMLLCPSESPFLLALSPITTLVYPAFYSRPKWLPNNASPLWPDPGWDSLRQRLSIFLLFHIAH